MKKTKKSLKEKITILLPIVLLAVIVIVGVLIIEKTKNKGEKCKETKDCTVKCDSTKIKECVPSHDSLQFVKPNYVLYMWSDSLIVCYSCPDDYLFGYFAGEPSCFDKDGWTSGAYPKPTRRTCKGDSLFYRKIQGSGCALVPCLPTDCAK